MSAKKQDRQSRTPEIVILWVSILIVLAIGGLSWISATSAAKASAELDLTRGIGTLNSELLSALKDAETGQRGFLLTGLEHYLEPWNQAASAIPLLLQRLEVLTATAPDQDRRLKSIEPLVAARLREMQDTIELRRSDKLAEALAIVETDRGEFDMDEIRSRCALVDRVADERSAQLASVADLYTSRLRVAGTVGSALLFGFLIVSAATIFRGLNRRDELLAQAHASEEKLAITLASIADGVIATDAFGSVNFLNPVAEQLTGWSLLDCAGRHIAEIFRIVNETTRETAANALERAISDGHAVGLANHTKLIAKDGREIHIDDSAAPIRDKNNRIIGAVLVFRDISERRQSEHNLAETTLALQRSNEDLEQFAFAASHDLRSPLRNVTTMALMIARRFGESLGNDGSAMVGHIADSADRMSRLVEDLLTLAKVTSPNREPPRPVSVQTALHAACESLRDEIQATAAIITADPLPVVGAVDSHVALLLQNMLSNAIKYRGPASPLIHVSALQESSEWIVSVKDNGIGIDPQYAEQIFQPFKRLHGSEYEGTGIGLWTCRKIVSACGGRIWVESEEGKGSTFFFSLPAPKLTG